ncbi:MAG: hypothetical protein Q9M50_07915 [Methylococcales bacterium]|nr:hypothetical protein [Methylococcales bacterium]
MNFFLTHFDYNPALFTVDAQMKMDVSILAQALLYSLDTGLDNNE